MGQGRQRQGGQHRHRRQRRGRQRSGLPYGGLTAQRIGPAKRLAVRSGLTGDVAGTVGGTADGQERPGEAGQRRSRLNPVTETMPPPLAGAEDGVFGKPLALDRRERERWHSIAKCCSVCETKEATQGNRRDGET